MKPICRGMVLAIALVATPCAAVAQEFTVKHTLSVSSDIRLVVDRDRGASDDEDFHFNWNRNSIDYKAEVFYGNDVRGVAHIRGILFGIHQIQKMNDLIDRRQGDPYRIDSDAAFIEIRNFMVDDLDLKFGRMIHTWGTADQFSPTNNLNAQDFEDPLRFGAKVPNQMVVATYYLPFWQASLQAVWIPLFKPAQLPVSATLGMDDVYQTPVRDESLKQGLIDEYFREKEQGATLFVDSDIRVNVPEPSLQNMTGGARLKMSPGGYDLSVSYFYGRHTFPVPKRIYAYSGADVMTESGPRTEQRQFVDLIYPRFHAIGFDFAASLPWAADLGVWLDLAVYHPERVDMLLYTTNYRPGDPCAAPGTKGSDIRLVCSQNSDPWYVKLTAGMDYTFTSWLYANVQYLHGFDDEFGYEGAINDYLAAGVDMKFFNDVLLVRLFTLFKMNDLSAVLFPQLILTKWDSTEITVGGIFNLGEPTTKFGMKASGRNQVFAKVTYTF
jgi:hypothetical protein